MNYHSSVEHFFNENFRKISPTIIITRNRNNNNLHINTFTSRIFWVRSTVTRDAYSGWLFVASCTVSGWREVWRQRRNNALEHYPGLTIEHEWTNKHTHSGTKDLWMPHERAQNRADKYLIIRSSWIVIDRLIHWWQWELPWKWEA